MFDLMDQLGLTQDTVSISYGQNGEDVRLWRVFSDIAHGSYVEVGGWDPVMHSISRSFYLRGWSGIVIEPVAECAERYRRVRPRDHVVSCLAGATDGIVEFTVVPETGLSTADVGVGARHGSTGLKISPRRTPMRRLWEIIDDFTLDEIHFMTIDVEGAEAEVIAGGDWGRHRPWVLVVEATTPGRQVLADIGWEATVLAAGYRYVAFDGLNRFYVAEEHSELSARLAACPNVFDRYRSAEWALAEAQRRASEAETERIRLQSHREWVVATQREQTLLAVLEQVRADLDRARQEGDVGRAELEAIRGQAQGYRGELDVLRQQIQQYRTTLRRAREAANLPVLAAEVGGTDPSAWEELIAGLAVKISSLEADRQSLHQALNSRSWRITRPLRRNH